MTAPDAPRRKPCIALMGEFSAGKSTLANLLIGSEPLPVQVIATQLPPVWITYGNAPPYRIDLEGNQHAIELDNLAAAPLEDTAFIRIFCEEDVLEHCDLLDMPGISDPNMSSDIWQRMISEADGVLWCSHATQAWRQSEAAVWASLPPSLYRNSILLLTRVDKLTSERDRQKVVRRVRAETEGLFLECLPISLLQATREEEDYEVWAQSGADEFAKVFAALLQGLNAAMPATDADNATPQTPLTISGLQAPEMPLIPDQQPETPEDPDDRILHRRVRVARQGNEERPPR